MKKIIHDILRRALSRCGPGGTPYELTPHHSGVRPGLDLADPLATKH